MHRTFGDQADDRRADVLDGPRRLAYSAFWAQALAPSYDRLSERVPVAEPAKVHAVLALVWAAVLEPTTSREVVAAAQRELEEVGPEIDAWPVLGYAGMEYIAASWDCLAMLHEDSAASTRGAFKSVVEHYLINRHHRGVLVASKEPDPLGLLDDPIWEEPSQASGSLLNLLERERLGSDLVATVREASHQLGAPFADRFARLGDALSRDTAER
jgi:hypothetical protein